MKGCSSESERSLAQPGGAFLHGLCRLKGSCSEGESVQFDENTIWTAGEENPGHQNPGPIHKTPILRGQNGRLTDEVNDLRLRWGDSLVNRLSARCAAIIDVEALRGGNTSRGAGSVSMRLSMSLHHSLSLAFAADGRSPPPFHLPGTPCLHKEDTSPWLHTLRRGGNGIEWCGRCQCPHIDGKGRSPNRMGRRSSVRPNPSLASDWLKGKNLFGVYA